MSKTNKVQLIGNLGQNPKIISQPNTDMVLTVSVATNDSYKDKEGNKQTKTEWHNIIAFGKTAELINTHLKSGSKACFWGKLQTRKYLDKDSNDRYSTEIVCEEVLFLGDKPE